MIKAKVYDQKGKVIGEEKLDSKIFEVPLNEELIHQAVTVQRANQRKVVAHAKGRKEVSGGGAKPWRQKGTGRARHGSIRSPIWRGGGVTFGPTKERSFKKRMNKKARRKALFMALSDKANDGKIIILDGLDIKKYKTKLVKQVLDSLPSREKKVLITIPGDDKKLVKSSKNLPKTQVIRADSLNILDLLKADFLILLKKSLKVFEKVYLKSA